VCEMASGAFLGEAIILIAAVIAASAFSSTLVSSLGDLTQAQRERSARIRTDVLVEAKVVFATATYGTQTVKIWVKNTGSVKVHQDLVKISEIFVKGPSFIVIVPYGNSTPGWTYSILRDSDGDERWSPGETLEITALLNQTILDGDYMVRFVAYTGSRSDYFFAV